MENEAAEVQQERSEESLGATEAEIKAGAVALTSGVAKTDRLTKAVEEKWYKFVVPDATGYTTIQFVKQDVEVSGNWSVQVFKENNLSNVYCEWRVDSKLITEKVTYEPGIWYLKVKGRWNALEDVDYSILTSFVADDSYEKECNDTKEKACALISDKTYHGRISRSDSIQLLTRGILLLILHRVSRVFLVVLQHGNLLYTMQGLNKYMSRVMLKEKLQHIRFHVDRVYIM